MTPLSRIQSAVSLGNTAEPGTSRLNPTDSAAWPPDGLSPWLSFLSPLTVSTTRGTGIMIFYPKPAVYSALTSPSPWTVTKRPPCLLLCCRSLPHGVVGVFLCPITSLAPPCDIHLAEEAASPWPWAHKGLGGSIWQQRAGGDPWPPFRLPRPQTWKHTTRVPTSGVPLHIKPTPVLLS